MDIVGSVWTHFSPNDERGLSETVVVMGQQRVLHTSKSGDRDRMGYNLECVVTTKDGRVSYETIGVYDEHILSWLERVA